MNYNSSWTVFSSASCNNFAHFYFKLFKITKTQDRLISQLWSKTKTNIKKYVFYKYIIYITKNYLNIGFYLI